MQFNEQNARDVIDSLKTYGITNQFMQAAILAILWKESQITPVRENMNYTSAARIRYVWPSKFPTDADAMPYVKQPQKLANYVYGGKYGNNTDGDGYKYRGGGYNGITFKSGYERFGKLAGTDILSNPDKLLNPKIAADVNAAYYVDTLKPISKYMGIASANDVPDLTTAVRAAMRSTAGWGSSITGNIFQEGEKKALAVAPDLLAFVESYSGHKTERTGGGGIGLWGIIAGVLFFVVLIFAIA